MAFFHLFAFLHKIMYTIGSNENGGVENSCVDEDENNHLYIS